MIIHDLRCPTGQIKHAANNQQTSLECLQSLMEDLYSLHEEDRLLLGKLSVEKKPSEGNQELVNLEQVKMHLSEGLSIGSFREHHREAENMLCQVEHLLREHTPSKN
mmetsp:Transcript_42181/g.64681  ORF Transcript_42181/g.64681 Transcript_42181/m.64681 type:complete len:107 (+) Transcript_42181:263-583(+)|eukprot:CAMPEP_0170513298 /NCGR_PEP_ID=MMETSP0208-20121228/67327_1 /TAXON_ID=197538 /ORGANISM="Strombidium inclinatum, Strain S3" /LENGTH=106 /DNA_ID=CAMNT_0010797021 /DNA_START=201 /DNA_END=521 /DNA_ORIENTATION=+